MPPSVDVASVLRRLGIEYDEVGDRLWARCPRALDKRYHARGDEDHSWFARSSLAAKPGYHFCFACKFGGGLVDLVAHVLGFEDDFLDPAWKKARQWLEEDAPPAEAEVPKRVLVRPSLVLAEEFRVPPEVSFAPVSAWPRDARAYLRRTRHVPDWQSERWGIGYADSGRLAGRVVVVTRDEDGRPVNYRARSVGGRGQKHLGPKTEDGPDKRAVLGEHLWPKSRAERRVLLLAEGAFNAFAMERAALLDPRLSGAQVGAMSGSNVHPETVARIGAWDVLVVATDEDAAGRGAREKLRAAFGRHLDLRVALFPTGEDADSVGEEECLRVLRRALFPRRLVARPPGSW